SVPVSVPWVTVNASRHRRRRRVAAPCQKCHQWRGRGPNGAIPSQLLSSRSFEGGEEMAFRASCAAVLLSSLLVAGCGTVANLVKSGPEDGGKTPFGGVREDEWWIEKAANGEFGCGTDPKSESGPHPQVAIMLLCAADWPFSLIGD